MPSKKIECPICLQNAKYKTMTICNHIFCDICLITHLINNQTCPMCRTDCDLFETISNLRKYRQKFVFNHLKKKFIEYIEPDDEPLTDEPQILIEEIDAPIPTPQIVHIPRTPPRSQTQHHRHIYPENIHPTLIYLPAAAVMTIVFIIEAISIYFIMISIVEKIIHPDTLHR